MRAYTVTLEDYPDLSNAQRQAAQARFRQVLEHELGSADEVPPTWQAWQSVESNNATDLSMAAWQLARRWIIAADKARYAALRGMPDVPDACFVVQVLVPAPSVV